MCFELKGMVKKVIYLIKFSIMLLFLGSNIAIVNITFYIRKIICLNESTSDMKLEMLAYKGII